MLCYHQDHVDIFRRWSKFGHRFDKKVGQKIGTKYSHQKNRRGNMGKISLIFLGKS